MAKSNTLETGLLKLIYQNIALANIGDVSGLQPSATAGSLYVALYTTNPTDADVGTEATYTSYARVAVVRSAVGWTVVDNTVSNAGILSFPANTGTSETSIYVAIRTAITGGDLLYHGALAAPLVVENGNIPKFEIGDLAISEN